MNLLLDLPPQKPTWVSAYLPINVEKFSTYPDRDTLCTNEHCLEVLKNFGNRQTRLIENELHYSVPYQEWIKLCSGCKKSFHSWYYKELLHARRRDRMPFEIFEINIEREAVLDLWKYLGEMLHYSKNDSDRDEIMETLQTVLNMYKEVVKRFSDKSKELNYDYICFDCVKEHHDQPRMVTGISKATCDFGNIRLRIGRF